MIARCDRCNRQLPDRTTSSPDRYLHVRDDIGIIDVLLCRQCSADFKMFLADCPLVGDNTRATAT